MLVESEKNKKAIRKNPLGRPKVTCTSPSNGGAKIQINTNSSISNLQQLLPKYNSQSSLKGLKTDIRRALGLPEKEGASDYGVFVIEDNGTSKECSIRISNHNANAGNYEGKESDTNISIKMRSRVNKNTFKPHKNIELMEYTYFDYLLMNVEQPIQKIILSIIEYLSNGIYNDKTGVALQNTSPQQVNNDTENNQELKENRNMNKKQVIRINENQLKRIVTESVKLVLSEAYGTPNKGTINAINNIRSLDVNKQDYHSLNSIYKQLLDARNNVDDWTTNVETLDDDGKRVSSKSLSMGYANLLVKQIDAAIHTCKMIMNKRVMNQGEQPDKEYFNK